MTATSPCKTGWVRPSYCFSLSLLCMTMWLFSPAALSAAVIALTGGDSTDGMTLDASNVVAAQTFNNATTATVQGVTFNSAAAGVNVSVTYTPAPMDSGIYGPRELSAGPPPVLYADSFGPTQTSANDTVLLAIDNTGLLYNSHTVAAPQLTVTITGLADNAPYTLDSLASVLGYGNYEGGAGRSEIVTSGTNNVSDQADIFNGSLYDIHQTGVLSNGSGTIVVTYSGVANPNYPDPPPAGGTWINDGAVLTAIVVTAVPEPGSLCLLGMGAIGVAIEARRLRKSAAA